MKLLIFLTALLIGSGAYAQDYYLKLEAGKAHFRGNGLWYNFAPITAYGYQWTAQETSNTFSAVVGRRTKWGAWEAAYTDFGETNSYAGYPYDPHSPALPSGCVYPCSPTQWVHHRGTAKGLSFAAVPQLRFGDAAVFAKAGATVYRATFEYQIANEAGSATASQFDGETSWAYYGVTPMYGVGFQFKALSVQFTRQQTLEARDGVHDSGSWKGVDMLTIAYRVPL